MTDPTTRVHAILDAATPGEWTVRLVKEYGDYGSYQGSYLEGVVAGKTTVAGFCDDYGTDQMADARAIVLSRNLLPAALDVVEAARRASDKRTADSDGFWISAREMRYIDEALDAYHAKEREELG